LVLSFQSPYHFFISRIASLRIAAREAETCSSWQTKTNFINVRFVLIIITIYINARIKSESGSSVGIATDYGLDDTGSKHGGGEIIRNCPERSWGPSSLLYIGYRVFPGGK